MEFSKEELRAIGDAIYVARGNWHDSWQFGHLTEEEEGIWETWNKLIKKLAGDK